MNSEGRNSKSAARVAVVIPTWNGRDLLLTCLASLDKQTFRDLEIVVVDDGSTDNTAAAVKGRFPRVRVVRMPENRGFCMAVNAGILNTNTPLVLLLNNDMTVAPDFVERLAAAADATGAAMLAPLILWRDEPAVIYSAGDRQRANGRPESVGFHSALDGFAFPETVFGVSAGAALYRREVFDAVGLFDLEFNIYFSDSDLSFRARLAGFEARFARDAVAYHVGSASLFGRTLKRTQQCYINHALLLAKNMPLPLLLRHGPAILRERLHQTRRLFSAARTEHGALRAAAIVAASWQSMLRRMPHAFAERRRIQRARRITCRELEALLSR